MRLRNIPGSAEVINNSGFVVKEADAPKGRWAEIFGNDHPLHIEIGMGKGRFIMDMAAKYPDINFVGIEMYDSVLIRAVQKAAIRFDDSLYEGGPLADAAVSAVPLPEGCNFRFIRMDARNIRSFFADGEVDRIYLNFSDPWPKDRHEHRRLTWRGFLKLYASVLKDGSHLEFKTDNRDLFDFSLAEVREGGWQLLAHTFDLHADEVMNRENVMTEYEEKFSSAGNPICKLIARP
ncbi:MAG: tRNA (guanosine(46)-N7)-methyltransferase TrmB [Eubacterium sp.]|nr:tRNA (guanosine(46)-N7)-methyltransferase TrmB [Eubacterium sp.]